jgi:hypothetical protein
MPFWSEETKTYVYPTHKRARYKKLPNDEEKKNPLNFFVIICSYILF